MSRYRLHQRRGGEARRKPRRLGITLLMVLVIMTITSFVLVGILDSQTVQLTALHNTSNYERALFLAGAGAQHAIAELELNASWNAGIASTTFPAGSGNTYSATVASGSGGTVIVTGVGVAGGFTRRLQVTIQPGG